MSAFYLFDHASDFETQEVSMKYKSIAFLIFLAIAVTALAQNPNQSRDAEIVGTGKARFLARFTGPERIGDSKVFQAPGGDIGIGTIDPIFPLHVFSNSIVPPTGQSFPVALYVEGAGATSSHAVVGIEGLASAGSGGNIGVLGVTYSPGGNGVYGIQPLTAVNGGGGVIGTTSATSGFSYGARGDALGTSGTTNGVFGQSNSPDGGGGFFQDNASAGGSGVTGVAYSTSGFAVGVRGLAVGTTGNGAAVFGLASSADGTAGLFFNAAAGNIIVGSIGQPPGVNVFRVDGTGRVYADGGFQPNGADYAESMGVAGDRSEYRAGDLLVIDPTASRRLALSQHPYSTLVAGIYSTKPGMLGSTRKVDEAVPGDEVPLGVVGIVPCKVTTENGPIKVGDLLVTSSTPGHAMKGTDRSRMLGAVVGKALEPMPQRTGVIQVLVTLQ
jgi:hypothetical protein